MLNFNKPIPPRKVLAVDLETNGLDPYTGRLLSVAVSDGTDVWLYLNGLHDMGKIVPVLEDATVIKVFHNAKFDLKWLRVKQEITARNVFDTYLAEAVLCSGAVVGDEDEEGKTRRLPMDLGNVLSRYGVMINKEERKTFIDHPGFDITPITNQQVEYIMADVLHLPMLYYAQIERVSKENAARALHLELDVLPATIDLELAGIVLDKTLWAEQENIFKENVARYDGEMRLVLSETVAVLDVPGKKKGEDIVRQIPADEVNFKSPKQLIEALKVLGCPVDTTREAALAELLENTALPAPAVSFVTALLEHRKWQKRLGFEYQQFVNPVTGRVHPDYHQLGAATGRFSCSNPNMQQVPRPVKGEPNIRNVFRSDGEDYVLIRADYSQQEPRVMAQLSGDPAMIEACNTEDVYIEFAKYMYGKTVEKGSPERQNAKTFVLAVGYGAGVDRLHKTTGIPLEECETTRTIIKQTFPQMASFGSRMERQAAVYGYVSTALGRRNYIQPGPRFFAQSVNSPVQGTAADMLKMAMVHFYVYLTQQKAEGNIDSNTRIWLLVHDEIVVQAHIEQADMVATELKRIMEEAGTMLCPNVRHIAEVGISPTWDK